MPELLPDVAMVNPRLAGSIKTLVDELKNGDVPNDPRLLRAFGEHVQEIGNLIVQRAALLEHRPDINPFTVDADW